MPSNFSRSGGRVSIDASVHDFYRQLTSSKNPEESPFITMKDLFMLAACIGFQTGKHLTLGRREQPFHYTVFTEQEDIPILKAIAIASTGDVSILSDPDKIVAIAEEYANAGIIDIRIHITEQAGQPLWNLIEAIRE